MCKGKVKLQGKEYLLEAKLNIEEHTLELAGNKYAVSKLALATPVSGTVYGTLLNYKGALAALGEVVYAAPYQQAPQAPVLYIKPLNTLNAYGLSIPMPTDVSALEMGAALGVVIGRTATRVKEEEALTYIEGYTVVNDVSIPHEQVFRPAVSYKARDGFCPIGPWIIDRDAVENPDKLAIRVFVNGELRQENNTSNLIRSVARLMADVTEFMTLHAGDTLLVGVPEGTPLAQVGDYVRIEIEGVGRLENTIVPEEEWLGSAPE